MQTQMRMEAKPFPPEDIPRRSWGEFVAGFKWRQGEHITIAAPTGWGKTVLGTALLPLRKYVCVLANKPKDDSMDELASNGYKVMEDWNPVPEIRPKVIVWPNVDKVTGLVERQRPIFERTLIDIYESGGWCLYLDELDYVCNYMKLKPLVELLWRQGRSIGVSVVGGTQRPAFIPLLAYDQASHLFIGRDNDEVNISRYAKIAGGGKRNVRRVMETISHLEPHEFLYISSRGFAEMCVTRVNV